MKEVDVRLVVLAVRRRALEALLVRLPGNLWALPGTGVGPGATLEAAGLDRDGKALRRTVR